MVWPNSPQAVEDLPLSEEMKQTVATVQVSYTDFERELCLFIAQRRDELQLITENKPQEENFLGGIIVLSMMSGVRVGADTVITKHRAAEIR